MTNFRHWCCPEIQLSTCSSSGLLLVGGAANLYVYMFAFCPPKARENGYSVLSPNGSRTATRRYLVADAG